jgi:DNA polymerase elongation subunit (family B)
MAIRRLFFDIETSPCIGWFWKPSYQTNLSYNNVIEDAKIICICYKWSNQKKIYSLKWDKNQNDKKMIADFIKVMIQADEIIGHNADRFDTKWIRTRAMFHNLEMPPDFKSIDTLKQSRALLNMPSNRLDSIGKYFGLGQKLENEKDLWSNVCFKNNQTALNRMVNYCKQDVNLLEQWFNKLNKYIKPKTHATGVKKDCPECGSSNTQNRGYYVSAVGTMKQKCSCNDCRKWYSFTPKK